MILDHIFVASWLIVAILLGVDPYSSYSDINYTYVVYLILIIISGYYFGRQLPTKKEKKINRKIKSRISLMSVFVALVILEAIFSGGLPIIWLITGSSKGYTDYGVPGLHGFVNALQIYLFINLAFKKKKNTTEKICQALILIAPIIFINRAIFLTNIIVLIYSKLKIEGINYKKIIVISLVFMVIFGIIGEIRTEYKIENSIDELKNSTIIEKIFSWVYFYATSPFANLINYIYNHNVMPDYGFVTNSFKSILPSPVRDLILNAYDFSDGYEYRVISAFNVSTAFLDPYKDLGVAGIFIHSALYGLYANVISNQSDISVKEKLESLGIYVFGISIFTNNLISLPHILCFIMLKKLV